MKLNIQPISVSAAAGTVTLLNGALSSLAGPIGFTPSQPRVLVKNISVTETSGTSTGFKIYKTTAPTLPGSLPILTGGVSSGGTVFFDQEIVLDAADYLICDGLTTGAVIVLNINANYEF